MKFIKKPVIIEAIQFIDENSVEKMLDAWGSHFQRFMSAHQEQGFLYLDTSKGVIRALPLDWIIQGVDGDFYSCKPDIFEASYEALRSE